MTELFLVNGRFHTQDLSYPRATAVAIRDGRLWAVGDDEEIRGLAGAGSRVIDLEGRLVLPGMTDGHVHYYDWSLGLRRLPLAAATSLDDVRARVAQKAGETPPGGWILGQGWNETRWPDPRMPTRVELDAAAPDHPVILWRNDLHLASVNSRALELGSVTGDTPDPPEGIIDRDEAGQPTGVLRDLAINLVSDVIPPATEDETVEAMRDGFAVLHRLGL
ncbi:MAG TPA: amidohydrolase family protein, partial [Phycisphaerae bacterium]|nr:amidohydrolase family protein [Phycisphaerae bacterium]